MNRKQKLIDNAISAFDKLKKEYPDIIIAIDAPNNDSQCKLGDALIYDGPEGSIIVFDAE